MSEPLDVRWSVRVLRRHARWLLAALLAGALLGAAYGLLFPPPLASTALVLLPPSPTTPSGTPIRDVASEVRIALSTTVLGDAGGNVTPQLSAEDVADRVQVRGVTDNILQIRAEGSSGGAAEQLANAVARAYIAYSVGATKQQSGAMLPQLQSRAAALANLIRTLQGEVERARQRLASEPPNSANSARDSSLLGSLLAEQSDIARLLDQVNGSINSLRNGGAPTGDTSTDNASGTTGSAPIMAQLLQPGTPASRPSLVGWMFELAAIVGLALVLLASIVLVAVERRKRRLWTRDEIAAALGAPVLGSMPARPQRDVAGWIDLLSSYRPSPVEEWSLRKTLRQLGIGDTRAERGSALLILCFDNDAAALALAPQLAITAAASGIPTVLVPMNGLPSAATFRAACTRRSGTAISERLRVESTRESELLLQNGEFVVYVSVVSRSSPVVANLPPTAATVLSTAAGRAAGDELARVAVAADDAGRPLDGVLVADPRPDDTSSGRFPATGRAESAVLLTRVTGASAGRRP